MLALYLSYCYHHPMKFWFKPQFKLYGRIVIAVFAVCMAGIGFQGVVRAENGNWLSTSADVVVQPLGDYAHPQCIMADVTFTVMEPRLNAGNTTIDGRLCVTKGKTIDLAMDSTGGIYVRRQDDSAFRVLAGQVRGRLTAGTNIYTYVSEDFLNTLWLTKDLASVIEQNTTAVTGEILSYKIRSDALTAQLPVVSSSNRYHQVLSYTITADGRYLVAYVDYAAIVKLDLDNGVSQKVLQPGGTDHDYAYNPKILAVSDDGRYVFMSTFLTMIDTNACGEPFVSSDNSIPMQHPCPNQNFDWNITAKVNYPFIASEAFFSENGNKLEFKTALDGYPPDGRDTTPKHVTITAAGYVETTSSTLKYLALGDSYSSGEGDIDGDGYWYQFSNEESEKCHLSRRSYPYLLRDMWHIDPLRMKSVACSGAKVLPDYYGGGNYYGQFGQLATMASDKKEEAQAASLSDFTPAVLHQIDFVKTYKPKVLTFTGGGNDVGFADIITYCAASYKLLDVLPLNETCAYADNPQMRADLNRTIDDQYQYNKALIEKIRQVSPETKIYMVGYPQFVKDDSFCFTNSEILNNTEIKFIRSAVTRMNNILKKAARDTGIYFVDIEESLAGGQICEGSKYMTGPVKAIVHNGNLSRDANMYHPNSSAHEMIAQTIQEKINDGMSYDIVDIPEETGGRHIIRQAVMPDYVGIGSTATITMKPGTITPNGEVTVEMYSNPINLGVFQADGQGGLLAQVSIPKSVGIGVHLLALTTENSEGGAIQIQQLITVISNKEGDIDDDGLADEQDNCFLITEWYIDGVNLCKNADRVSEPGASNVLLSANSRSTLLEGEPSFSLVSSEPGKENDLFQVGAAQSSADIINLPPQKQNINLWWITVILCIMALGVLYGKKRYKERIKNKR